MSAQTTIVGIGVAAALAVAGGATPPRAPDGVLQNGRTLQGATATRESRDTEPPPPDDGMVRMLNEVLTFDWPPSGIGFGFYTSMNADWGYVGESSSVEDGLLRISPPTNGWKGIWISLREKDTECDLTVNLKDPMPPVIESPYRMKVPAIRLRVKGHGSYQVEFQRCDGTQIQAPTVLLVDSDTFVDQYVLLQALDFSHTKRVNVVTNGGWLTSDLSFDQIDLVCDVPQFVVDDELLYGFLPAYAQLLRAYDDVTGFTRDHVAWPAGDFDSVPATGLQISCAAAAYNLGVISLGHAQEIAGASASAILSVQRPCPGKLLPHFLYDGQAHPDSEWSSVDTAIACVGAIQGLVALGEPGLAQDVYDSVVDEIDFDEFTSPNGEISHGFYHDCTLIPYYWTTWGGELSLVEVLRGMCNPALPPATADRYPETDCGRGFIVELAALAFPQFGAPPELFPHSPDRFGTDWYLERMDHLAAQKAAHPGVLFGLSAVEIMRYSDAATKYCTAGIGATHIPCDMHCTEAGFGDDCWIAPHYMSMSADLEPSADEDRIAHMRDDLEVWPPLNGPAESLQQLTGSEEVLQWHRAQVSLNAAFNTLGLYHAICARDGRPDALYAAVEADQRLLDAVCSVYYARCDMNCDGVINNQDIDGFIFALFDLEGEYAEYLHSFPEYRPCTMLNADCSGDGLVNNQDIDCFVEALFGG